MLESVCMLMFYRTTITTNRNPQNDLIFDANFEHYSLYFQGATAPTRLPTDKSPLHHEGGLPYTILHGKTSNPKHIAK